jgi:UDP-N-acetylglucosamine acyltransferase
VKAARNGEIHAHAIVAPGARLGARVKIGAYAVVGEHVELGEGCMLDAHAVVQGPAKIGRNNVFHPFCSVGGDPQDLKFHGEQTELTVGDGNTFREFVTVSRGTVAERRRLEVGVCSWRMRTWRTIATSGMKQFLRMGRRWRGT